MEKRLTSNPYLYAIGLLALAWLINYISAKTFSFPIAYCWLSPGLSTLYLDRGLVILYASMLLALVSLFFGKLGLCMTSSLVFVAVIELPRFGYFLFNQGGSCV